MKHRLIKFASGMILFLLLGAVVNFVVVWICAAQLTNANTAEVVAANANDIRWWVHHAPAKFARRPQGTYEWGGFGWRVTGFNEIDPPQLSLNPLPYGEKCHRLRGGWPCFALEGSSWCDRSGINVIVKSMLHDGDFVILGRHFALPTKPLWIGTMCNTAFYASIIWMFFVVRNLWVRSARYRRGLCPWCKYPMATSPICTECGKPVKA